MATATKEPMTKAELTESMYASGLFETKAAAGRAVEAFLDSVKGAIRKGRDVRIHGFGTFKPKKRKARDGVNPATGEKIRIAASKSVGFKPSPAFKDSL